MDTEKLSAIVKSVAIMLLIADGKNWQLHPNIAQAKVQARYVMLAGKITRNVLAQSNGPQRTQT